MISPGYSQLYREGIQAHTDRTPAQLPGATLAAALAAPLGDMDAAGATEPRQD